MSLNTKKSTISADVAIVGAGPAGSSLAYLLAKQGLNVSLLESKKLPRKKPCGDGLGPKAVKLLNYLGLGNWLEKKFYRIEKLRLVSEEGTEIISRPYGSSQSPSAYVVRREKLDQKIVNLAISAGAQFYDQFRVIKMTPENKNTRRKLIAIYQEKNVTLESKLIVAADGSSGSFSRQFGKQIASAQAIACRGYLSNIRGAGRTAHIYFSSYLPKGYNWIFPLSETSANVGSGSLGMQAGKIRLKKALQHFIKSVTEPINLDKAVLQLPVQGSVMRMNFLSRPIVLPQIAFIGDAAGLVSPINGEGISHAIHSSFILASCLENHFKSQNQINQALSRYQKEIHHHYNSYFRWSQWLDRWLSNPKRLNWLIRKAAKDDYLTELIVGVMSNTIHPRELSRLKNIKKFIFK